MISGELVGPLPKLTYPHVAGSLNIVQVVAAVFVIMLFIIVIIMETSGRRKQFLFLQIQIITVSDLLFVEFHMHRRTGPFFLGGLSHLCLKNIPTAPEKLRKLLC